MGGNRPFGAGSSQVLEGVSVLIPGYQGGLGRSGGLLATSTGAGLRNRGKGANLWHMTDVQSEEESPEEALRDFLAAVESESEAMGCNPVEAAVVTLVAVAIRDAYEAYVEDVMASDLADSTKQTYLTHASRFVRYVRGEPMDFMKGGE